jgi:hypothetical protein
LGNPAPDKPAQGADPSTAGEPCDKRFDQDRSVVDGIANIVEKMDRHFLPAML